MTVICDRRFVEETVDRQEIAARDGTGSDEIRQLATVRAGFADIEK